MNLRRLSYSIFIPVTWLVLLTVSCTSEIVEDGGGGGSDVNNSPAPTLAGAPSEEAPAATLAPTEILALPPTAMAPAATVTPAEAPPTESPPPTPTQEPAPPVSNPDPDPLSSAIDGLGGMDALGQLASFVITANISRHAIGEGPDPNLDAGPAVLISSTVSHDIETDGIRLDYVREGEAAASYSEIIAGNLGYMLGSDSRFGFGADSDMASDRVASTLKLQRLVNPHLLIRQAASDSSLASDGGTDILDGVEHFLLVIADDVAPLTLFVNPDTGAISKLETIENDHWLRDVVLEVYYDRWQMTESGLAFPLEVSIYLEGILIHQETREPVEVNVPLPDDLFQFAGNVGQNLDAGLFATGESTSQVIQMFSALGFPQPALQTAVDGQEIAPGIYHLRGSSHHSLAVEQESGIVIAEAPLYPERSEAVIAWVEEQFPDKPITQVISSHHHRDHSSGLRSYVARGIPVVMSELATDLFLEIFARPSTILPDALAENQIDPVIVPVAVGGAFMIPDPERPVTVGSIAPDHAADTVFTYVGGGQVVFLGDGNAQTPELRTALENAGLTAVTFAGGHGDAVPFE